MSIMDTFQNYISYRGSKKTINRVSEAKQKALDDAYQDYLKAYDEVMGFYRPFSDYAKESFPLATELGDMTFEGLKKNLDSIISYSELLGKPPSVSDWTNIQREESAKDIEAWSRSKGLSGSPTAGALRSEADRGILAGAEYDYMNKLNAGIPAVTGALNTYFQNVSPYLPGVQAGENMAQLGYDKANVYGNYRGASADVESNRLLGMNTLQNNYNNAQFDQFGNMMQGLNTGGKSTFSNMMFGNPNQGINTGPNTVRTGRDVYGGLRNYFKTQ